jgi:hypothetical protein
VVTSPAGRPPTHECFRPGCPTCYPVAEEHAPVRVEAEPEKKVRSGTKLEQTRDAILVATGLRLLGGDDDDTTR